MTGARAIWLVVALAICAIVGIAGMLLVEGGWDRVFFGMALLPLAVGASRRWWRQRPTDAAGNPTR